jgi:probable phosphoglycerate mutase
MTDLLLIRHGQALHNLEGRWEGWGATPLTEEGQRQAEFLAQRLKMGLHTIGYLCASPLLRARQTAEPISRRLGLPVVTHEGLREIDFGQVSGLTVEGFKASMPETYARWQDRGDLAFQFPGGEQRLAFFRRVGDTLEEIIASHPGEVVVAVAHGGTIRAGLAYLLPDTMGDWWGYALQNASLTHVRAGGGRNELVTLGCCKHLGVA